MRFYWIAFVAAFWISWGAALGWKTGADIYVGLVILLRQAGI